MARQAKILEHLEPQERLKQLIDYSNSVEVDPHVPPMRYYRSGIEMVRMANVYYEEGSLENAYVLYLKFMTLFLEKIRKHPDFTSVPIDVKARNQAKMREVLPKAEKLKQQLLNQYKDDYSRCLAEMKQQKKEENEQRKKDNIKNAKPRQSLVANYVASTIIKDPGNLDNVKYPEQTTNVPCPPSSVRLPTLTSVSVPGGGVPIRSRVESEIPLVDRTQKPSETSLNDRYDTTVLRGVQVPVSVLTLFQAMALSNTVKNIETCGVLTGKLEQNKLIVTHMILPKQKGTSDSCMTMHEEEIFDYQDHHNLITLGWIHTHPTQTAFLSSVDLHTHCPYQLLMPEAIAIVCSPKYNEVGYFHLTPNYGLQFIANCRKTGFHPHPTDPPIYVVAEHARVDHNAPLEVLDLRNV